MSPRRLFLASCICAAVSMGLSAAPALAKHTKVFSAAFAGSGTNALSGPTGVAVDNSGGPSAHDVYVTDPGHARVEKFDSSGNFLLMFGKGVDQTTGGDVCPEAPADVCQPGTPGSEPGAFNTPSFIAIDNSGGPSSGDLYVGDTGVNTQGGTVSKFDPSGHLISSWNTTGQLANLERLSGVAVTTAGDLFMLTETVYRFDENGTAKGSFSPPRGTSPAGLAVDAENNLYKADGSPQITKFTETGENIDEPDVQEDNFGLAIDPATNDLFVVQREAGEVHEFGLNCGQGCEPVDSFGAGELSSPNGIGIDGTTGATYVANTGAGNVIKFITATIPDVATEEVTNPGQTSGEMHGHLDPAGGGTVTTCYFEYGPDKSYAGGQVPCEPAAPYSVPTDVHAELTGLTSDVTYHYRLVAGNVTGVNRGADRTYTPHAVVGLTTKAPTSLTSHAAKLEGSFVGNGEETKYYFEWGTESTYGNKTPEANAGSPASPTVTPLSFNLTGLTPQTEYHYRVVATNSAGTSFGEDQAFSTKTAVESVNTEPPTSLTPTSAQLNGSFVGDGTPISYYFEYGMGSSFETSTTELSAGSPTGPTPTKESASISELLPATEYSFRLVAKNSVGTTFGNDVTFNTPPSAPLLIQSVSDVHSDVATLHVSINPGGGETTYRFEYGTQDCATSACTSVPVPEGSAGKGKTYVPESVALSGLAPGTTYYWRVTATNATGTTVGDTASFKTYESISIVNDPCTNSHVRQQTGSALLPDCRAYELVSALESGGYDVESSLISGQEPFGGYPNATGPSKVLYGVHGGGIPGTGQPTDRGVDPYVATRGNEGWTTEYVGIPADQSPTSGPFSSTVGEADESLGTFAFAGSICSPCFESGVATGIPVHLPDGQLAQGMAGSLSPAAGASPAGHIGRYLSADGSHLVFGSTSQFEPDGNSGGDISIYDRDLTTGQTHVVSKTPAGATMTGAGIAELGMSQDGSHILIGQRVSTDTAGNVYYHPYMNVGDSGKTLDLAPGSTHGVLFDGMTNDGSKVFFTTPDALTGDDTDESADVYEAEIAGSTVSLHRLSSGSSGTGNSVACNPVAGVAGPHWNSVEGAASCAAVVVGGQAIGQGDGTVFFLSPEKLDGAGNGVQDQPNLYLVALGEQPSFIATLSPTDAAVRDALAPETHPSADFEVTPSGNFAAFASTLPLTGSDNAGHVVIYRYSASGGQLSCVSCAPTNAQVTSDAAMASDGLSLSGSGQVFFTTKDPLTSRDNDHKRDVYEWENGAVELISTGTSPFDSGLLSVSSDGTDAYFFTRDHLAPQDVSGDLMKIYDARAGGGFPFTPAPIPCKASDECHGAGTTAPPAPEINSLPGSTGNLPPAKPKHHHHHKKPKHHHRTRKHHRHG